jgi:hypothetical protein
MTNTNTAARTYQWGKESSAGTAVAATERVLMELDFESADELMRPQMARGLQARNGADEFFGKRSVNFTGTNNLLFEQFHTWLAMSVAGGVSASGSGTSRTWDFARTASGIPSLDAFTLERRLTDGSNHLDNEFAYAQLRSWEIAIADGEAAQLSVDGFTRRKQSSTLTSLSGVDAQPAVEYPVHPRVSVFIDDSSSFGSTQISSQVLALSYAFNTGLTPLWTCDNRADLDWTLPVFSSRESSLEITATMLVDPGSSNGDYATEVTKADAAALRYLRVLLQGRDIDGGTRTSITLDSTVKHEGVPLKVGTQDGQDIIEFKFVESLTASTPWIDVSVVNTRAALADGTAAA